MNQYFKIKNYTSHFKRRIFKFLSRFIRIWENNFLIKYGNRNLKHQPIFIIGAPRTGSTILYQMITNRLDVQYIDNIACNFHRNIFFGMWLSNKLFKNRPHNSSISSFGNTSASGLRAPSECGFFWYRWLPTDRHFIDFNDFSKKTAEEIRQEITAVINYFNKPIIFKNLNAGQRLRLIQACFPEAKFIFIKRNPYFTAQDILESKRKLGLKDEDYWSIKPKNILKLKTMKWPEQIVKQVYYLERQIVRDQKLFPVDNFLELEYVDLENQQLVFENIKKFIGASDKEEGRELSIIINEHETLNKNDISLLKKEIQALDWDSYED